MKVAKWGNSLAIRIPADVARVLQLREGDEVTVQAAGKDTFTVEKDASREEVLARIRAIRCPMPKGWKFNRAELYED